MSPSAEHVRRLRQDFGVTRADLFAQRVVAELGEPAAAYWFATYFRLLELKRDSGENAVRFARWAYSRPGAVRFLRDEAQTLDRIAALTSGRGWTTLRAWLAPSLRRKARRAGRRGR